MRKRILAAALILIFVFLVPFFSYFAYAANHEKTVMDNLSFVATYASIDSIMTDMLNYYIAGSVVVSIRLNNPTVYETPTFSVNFAWYFMIPTTSLEEEREHCGTEKTAPMKISSGDRKDLTLTMAFDLKRASLDLINAIQARQAVIILGGSLSATTFFGLIPISKPFLESRTIDE